MGVFIGIVALFLATATQASFAPQIAVLGGKPDFVFLVVIAWAMRSELDEAVVWAFIGGVFQDIMSIQDIGISTLGMIVTIFLIDRMRNQFVDLPILLMLIIVLIGGLIQQIIQAIALIAVGTTIDLIPSTTYIIVPTLLYNVILFIPIYIIIRFIQSRIEKRTITTDIA